MCKLTYFDSSQFFSANSEVAPSISLDYLIWSDSSEKVKCRHDVIMLSVFFKQLRSKDTLISEFPISQIPLPAAIKCVSIGDPTDWDYSFYAQMCDPDAVRRATRQYFVMCKDVLRRASPEDRLLYDVTQSEEKGRRRSAVILDLFTI
jgi:hypothetical protein